MKHSLHRLRGNTVAEVTIAAGLSTIVLFAGVGIFISGMTSWARGEGRMDAEGSSSTAIRKISVELREAMLVTVDSDGQGLTYRLPTKSSDGRYSFPATWDNVYRRIELVGSNLQITAGESRRTICSNVITTDPNYTAGTLPYRVFVPGPGTIIRSLNVMLVARKAAEREKLVTSRTRETIFLRNIPELVR